MLATRGLVQYEPRRPSVHVVPRAARPPDEQRALGAGMFEGLHAIRRGRSRARWRKLVAGIDYLVPLLDLGYICFWVPGFILLLAGYPLIVAGGRCC